MLNPTKNSDPDKTIIGLAVFLLYELKKAQILPYEKLKSIVKEKLPDDIPLLLSTLCLLYILGVIAYYPVNDTIAYKGGINPDEAVQNIQ